MNSHIANTFLLLFHEMGQADEIRYNDTPAQSQVERDKTVAGNEGSSVETEW